MKTEKMYHLAIRRKDKPSSHFWQLNDFYFEECSIECYNKYWLADPFIFEKDNNTYIFFEAFDLVSRSGKIGYSILRNDGTCTPVRIIIDEPFHLSFPYIFEMGGDVYIMPESSDSYSLRLYKALSFPDIWTLDSILLPDTYCCDCVIFKRKESYFLLTNEMYHNTPTGTYPSCWVKNYLYSLTVKDGHLSPCNGEKVGEGDYGIRNAGKAFSEDGILYRIGQDCRNKQYGRGLVLFKVHSLDPYYETEHFAIDCKMFAKHIRTKEKNEIIGVHTYNATDKWEIIDFACQSKVNSSIRFRRLNKRICRFMRAVRRLGQL